MITSEYLNSHWASQEIQNWQQSNNILWTFDNCYFHLFSSLPKITTILTYNFKVKLCFIFIYMELLLCLASFT